MRMDSHQHFWNYNEADYGWMSDELHAIRRSFVPEHLKLLLDENNVEGTVVVQARQSIIETEWLLSLAETHSIIKGVVGWLDLCSEDIGAQLKQYAANPYLKGIRHVVQDEPDEQFMLREDFQRGIALLHNYGLTYDLLVFPIHLPYAVELVQKFPEQPFVLDHIGKPNLVNGDHAAWTKQIMELGTHTNVYCKLSGMVTEAPWGEWRAEDFAPYMDTIFEAFGTDRVMIGSDWPVCTVSGSYSKVMNIVKEYIKKFSPEEQENILGNNCCRFYHIEKL